MDRAEAAWLAGFLDGEGSFMILRTQRYGYTSWTASLAATSTDEKVLRRCQQITGGGKICSRFKPKGNAKEAQIWTLNGPLLDLALERMLPFLITKREQAAILLKLRRETRLGALPGNSGVKTDPNRNARRDLMRLAVQALNHRGTTEVPADRLQALEQVRATLR